MNNEISEQIEYYISRMSHADSVRDLMQIEAEALSFLLGLAMAAKRCEADAGFFQSIKALCKGIEHESKLYGDALAAEEEKRLNWGCDDEVY